MPEDEEILSEDQEVAEPISPNYTIPYGEICQLEESRRIILFNTMN